MNPISVFLVHVLHKTFAMYNLFIELSNYSHEGWFLGNRSHIGESNACKREESNLSPD